MVDAVKILSSFLLGSALGALRTAMQCYLTLNRLTDNSALWQCNAT